MEDRKSNTPKSAPPNSPHTQGTESGEQDQEIAHYDDAIIGRAFRWSLFAAITLVVVSLGFFFWLRRPAAPISPKVTKLEAPTPPAPAPIQIPEAKFKDVTTSAGITFVHHNGAYGDKLLPETMGSGCAFFDFDNDGDQDLLLVNGTDWPWHAADAKPVSTAALYRNDGKGHFADVTQASGLDVSFYGTGVAVGDYNNDGLPDVFMTAVGKSHLFHNQGAGKFEEVTARAGVGGSTNQWTTSSAWLDYDNDGRLDLLVCNYVKWSREIDFEVAYTLVGIGRAYGQPMNFEGSFPSLYHNEGDGRFVDVSERAGLQMQNPATRLPMAKSLGVAPADLDGDGWIDFVIANDTVQNFVFVNQRDGTFKEVGAVSGVGFDSLGSARGAMGIDIARFRNDGSLGIAIGNFANEMTALYVAQSSPLLFADEAIPEGIGPSSRKLLKFGVFFFDYDLDGWIDLLSANGHLEEEISKVQKSQQYAQPAQLFRNMGLTGSGGFVEVPRDKAGEDLFKPIVGRGSAFADIDGDGDLDVILTQVAGPPLLLRNDQALGHHWLRLKLVGKKNNRDAIGAWVRVRRNSQIISQQVMPARSYLSQCESVVTIGLGEQDRVDEVEIIWPGGKVQKVAGLPIDRLSKIEESN